MPDPAGTVAFCGEQFGPPDAIDFRTFLRFASLTKQGLDTSDARALASVDAMIDQCVRDEDVDRFDAVCAKNRASLEHLLEFIGHMLVAVVDRPTQRSSDSSSGLTTTEPPSTSDSVTRVMRRLDGRPDLQLMVEQAQQQMTG